MTNPLKADEKRETSPLPGVDPAQLQPPRELMHIDPVGDEYVLRMSLPLASKSSVDAARVGDDLVVTVSGNRRVLTLPSMLRRCVVVGGDFDGNELKVRFRPDENQWPRDARGASA